MTGVPTILTAGLGMLAATERANIRLNQIGDLLAEAARENVLASLVAADDVAAAWEEMDQSRARTSEKAHTGSYPGSHSF